MTQVVGHQMTLLLFQLLEAGVVTEEHVAEPVEMHMGLDLALEQALGGDGGVPPAGGGLTPSEVVAAAADGEWELLGLAVRHNLGHRGWWFALEARELRNATHRIINLDAHITMFYLNSDQDRGNIRSCSPNTCVALRM